MKAINIEFLRIFKYLGLVILTVLFTNCQGDEGPMGPSGPRGEKGQDGAPGIANVYTTIYDVNPGDWNGNVDGYTVSLVVPEINSVIYQQGAVLVYRLFENSTDKSFNMLPYTWIDNNLTEYMDFDVYIGKLEIKYKWVDNGINNTDAPKETFSFKVVIIEGTMISTMKQKINISNFNEVELYLKGKNYLE